MSQFGIQSLRKNSRSTLIYVLFGMLIIVFIFTFNTSGPGGCATNSVNPLVRVYDDVIDARRLALADALAPRSQGWWSRTRFVLQPAYADDIQTLNQLEVLAASRLPIDSPAFEEKAWLRYAGFRRPTQPGDDDKNLFLINDLVEASLVAREARKLGLTASRREIEDRILFDGLYDPDTGTLNKQALANFLSSLGTTKDALADFMADEILREKMIELIASTVVVSEAEINEAWLAVNDRVRFEYVGFDPKQLASFVPVDDDDIKKAREDKAAIQSWYDAHKTEFVREKAVKVRTILFDAPAQTSVDTEDDATKKKELADKRSAAQQKAGELLTKLSAETDGKKRQDAFAEAAKASSGDKDTKDVGGLRDDLLTEADLTDETNAEVAKAAIALNANELSAVIATENGFWVILCDEVRDARNTTVEQATDIIAPKVAQTAKSVEWAKSQAESFLKTVEGGKSFEDAIADWNEKNKPATEKAAPGGPSQPAPPEATKTADETKQPSVEKDTPPADAPKADAPKADAPKADAPKADAPKADAPKADAPKADAETNDSAPAKVEEAPAADTPNAEKVESKSNGDSAPAADAKGPLEVPTLKVGSPTPAGTTLKLDTPQLKLGGDRIPGTLQLDTNEANIASPGALRLSKSPLFGQRQSHTFATGDFEYPAAASKEQIDGDRPVDADDNLWARVPGVGVNPELMATLFALTMENPLVKSVYASEDGQRFYVIRLSEREKPEENEDAAQEKAEMRRKLRAQRQRETYKAWYASLFSSVEKAGDLEFEETYQTLLKQAVQQRERQAAAAAAPK
jgi:hypothetical protein